MGLKLRSQIVGILFSLFTVTVGVLGYLNLTLLLDAMQAQAEERCALLTTQVVTALEQTMPEDGYTSTYLKMRLAQRGDLARRLQAVRDLRALQIISPEGSVLFAHGPSDSRYDLARDRLRQVLLTGRPDFCLWAYESVADLEGHPVGARAMLLPHAMAFEAYHPIFASGRIVAVYHLSLQVQDIPQRLRVMFLGNLLLSGIFVITAFVAISAWTTHAISTPLERVLQAQQQIGKGDFTANVQLEAPSTNEVVRIIASFNRMSADLRRFRKELEEKTQRLERVNQEYQRLNESLESQVDAKTRDLQDFFGVVTHDLKVPLAAIQGYADLLERSRDSDLTAKQLRYVQGIGVACNHLLGLTRNMMEAVAYDAGKIRYYIKEMSLDSLVDEVVTQLSGAFEEKGVRLVREIPPSCAEVRGDPSKVAQVLINLMNNALKFSSRGQSIQLRAEALDGLVAVHVEDQGVGIPAEHVPYLFEKFSQFHTVEGSSSSMGLGLYIVGRIMAGHGQAITVTSTPGQGSCFTFTLERVGALAQGGLHEEEQYPADGAPMVAGGGGGRADDGLV